MIEATKTGPGVVQADGYEARNRAPVLALCRMLVAAGHPDTPLVVRDMNGRPLMTVRSIAEAAGLTVLENANNGPRFTKFVPFTGIGGDEA